MPHDIGDVWTPRLEVRDSDGVLTAATVEVTVTSPSGATSTPTVVTVEAGIYEPSVPLTEAGRWQADWDVSGAITGVQSQSTYVRTLGSNVIPLEQVKARLDETVTADDDEIEEMLDAALAEYAEWVGPPSGSVTEVLDGGVDRLLLGNANAVLTSVAYADGTALSLDDLTVSNGIIYWNYNTAGYFTWGRRNVTVTYTVGALPANHRETIIADVAGYFAATQRGSADLDAGGYDGAWRGSPVVLFQRIRALAVPSIA